MAKTTDGAMSSMDSDNDWQAESDVRCLAQAEEIKSDPKRYKAALAMAKEKMAELQALQTAPKK